MLKKDKRKGQDVNQETMCSNSSPQDLISTEDIYDAVEDDYQELGQLSEQSRYDQLRGPKT